MDKLYTFNPKALWLQFRAEPLAFKMVCFYIILEYVRPQSIYPELDFVPWDKIVIGLAVLALPMDPHRGWVRNRANFWLTTFFIVLVAASIFATFPSISWKHWFDFFGWFAVYFLIINSVTTAERYFVILAIFLVANFKLAFFGARLWMERGFGFSSWGIAGPQGYFQNSSDLSSEMLMFAPIAFELALFVKPKVKRVTYGFLMLGAISGAMTVLGASSRGSQVALAAQVAGIAIQRKLKMKILVAIAIGLTMGYALLPAAERARFASAGTDNTSIQRLDYWRAGLKMIESHPFLGVGYFNFAPLYALRDPTKLWHGTAQLPHNIFIQVGTDAGLIGLGVFLMLIYRSLKTTKDIRLACENNRNAPAFAPNIARGLVITTWGFVIAGQFNTVSYYPFFWINLSLIVALSNVVNRSMEGDDVTTTSDQVSDSQMEPASTR